MCIIYIIYFLVILSTRTNLQDDTLSGTLASVDVSTTKNLENLVKVGEELLKKPVSGVNIETGLNEPIPNGGTNEDALKRYVYIYMHSTLI